MNPLLHAQKADMSTMGEQEKKLFERYGKLPPKKNILSGMKERKYFDSGDYNMHKAGVKPEQLPGTAIPTPERLPHVQPPSLSSSPNQSSTSPPQFNSTNPFTTSNPFTDSPAQSEPTTPSPPQSQSLSNSQSSMVGGIGIPVPLGRTSPRASVSSGMGMALSPPGGNGNGFAGRRPSVGVAAIAIPPANAMDGTRHSPPLTYSPLSSVPPSSFPIQTPHHNGPASMPTQGHVRSGSISGLGSSPVKPSNLGLGMKGDYKMDGVDENALED